MDVDVVLRVEIPRQPEPRRARADVGDRRMGALLHHVAEVPRDHHVSLPVDEGHLDEEDVSTRRGPGKARRDSDLVDLPLRFRKVRGAPRYFARLFGVMAKGPFSPSAIFRASFRHTWPISRSRFRSPASRVYSWMMAKIVLSLIVTLPRRIPFSSSWRGKRYFLAIASLSTSVYPGQGDDLHPVLEGRRDGVDDVRRGDEQDLRKIEGDVQVVVAEREVLLWVQYLEQRADGSPGSRRPPCRSRPA